MSTPGKLVLKCTSIDATARITIQHLGDGPTGSPTYAWLLGETREVMVHDGDVEDLCTEVASGQTFSANSIDAIAGSADLDSQLKDTTIGGQPADEGGNVERDQTLFIYVPTGRAVTGLNITIGAYAAEGTNLSDDTNIGWINVDVQADEAIGSPPTLEMIQANSCGLKGLGPTGDDFDTRYYGAGTILDGTVAPVPGVYLMDFGFTIHSPMVIRLSTAILVGASLDILFRTQATITGVELVTA